MKVKPISIKIEMVKLGINQVQLSRLTGIDKVTISKILREQREPRRETVEKICDVLNCDIEAIAFLESDIKNTIGDLIRSGRINRNMNQKELSDKLGVSRQLISQWESGKRSPGLSSLKKIADALDVSFHIVIEPINTEIYTIKSLRQ